MKTSSPSQSPRVAALLAALTLSAVVFPLPSASAATLYWDTNGTTAGVGGSGTWSDGSGNWSTGTAGTTVATWTNTNRDAANFQGAVGTGLVSISGGVSASSIAFGAGGYTLSGSDITLGRTTGTNSVHLLDYTAGTGANVVSSNIIIDDIGSVASGTTSSSVQYIFSNTTSGELRLDGDITLNFSTGTAGGYKAVTFRASTASSVVTVNGDIRLGDNGGAADHLTLIIGDSTNSVSSLGTYYLNGDNRAAARGTNIYGGTVVVGGDNALGGGGVSLGSSGTPGGSAIKVLSGGAFTIANAISVGAIGNSSVVQLVIGGNTADVSEFSGSISAGNGAQHLRLSAISGGRVNFSGALSGTNAGGGTIIKEGSGVVALTHASGNGYSRDTAVNEGTLVLANTSGSATGTGTVTVADGATLAGDGIASGLVTASAAGSRFSAGDMTKDNVSSIGTLTLGGGLTAAGGATFACDVNGSSVDLIDFGAGTLSLSGTVTFDFTNLGAVQTGAAYTLFTGSGDWSGSVAASYVFNGPAGYVLDTSYGSGNGYLFDAANHSLTVQFVSAIPEPSTCALLAGLCGLIVVCIRRSRNHRLT